MGFFSIISDIKIILRMLLFDYIPIPKHKQSISNLVCYGSFKYPNKVLFVDGEKSYSWLEFNNIVNGYVCFLQKENIKKGDVVSLIMANSMEYVAILTACNRIGVIAGLINTNLKLDSILIALNSIKSNKVFCDKKNLNICIQLYEKHSERFTFYYLEREGPSWTKTIDCVKANNINVDFSVGLDNPCYYIFTSGTSSQVKPILITNRRWFTSSYFFSYIGYVLKKKDVMLCYLPFYHGTGLHAALSAALISFSRIVIKEKFSARNFVNDVNKYNITCFPYVGEVCRYILKQFEIDKVKFNNKVRCVGNGLSNDLWLKFKKQLNISRIAEFYALSEGNLAFINSLNKDKTIGFSFRKFKLVRFNAEDNSFMKDKNGYLIPLNNIGEPGVLLSQLSFKDYTYYMKNPFLKDRVLKNVFKEGDLYFNTGDILKRVHIKNGYGISHYQFVDRFISTFRWKSENISPSFIKNVLLSYDKFFLCDVSGVKLPGIEGKAVVAFVKLKPEVISVDMSSLYKYLSYNLPIFALPLFFCFLSTIELTSSFKVINTNIKFEDLKSLTDVYILRGNEYILFNQEIYNLILCKRSWL